VSGSRKDIHLEASVRVYIHSDRPRPPGSSGHQGALCKGTAALLQGIREMGSLNKAVESLGVDYSKSLARLHKAERELGFKLYTRRSGRLGSTLTHRGAEFLDDYLVLCAECEEFANARLSGFAEKYRRDHRRRKEPCDAGEGEREPPIP
jgi:molybdate transport repressor ModE-like protein